MDVSQVSVTTIAMAVAVRELQATSEAQMVIMKSIADSQQQVSQILQAAGIGQTFNIQA